MIFTSTSSPTRMVNSAGSATSFTTGSSSVWALRGRAKAAAAATTIGANSPSRKSMADLDMVAPAADGPNRP